MKRFSRCVLILILVAILSGVSGYMYENKMIYPMYESTTQLYVVPGEENEASIRANNGGLKEDFTIIFKSSVVISAAQRVAGTSEDIAQYLTVSSPANSNIVEIKCVNPDQNTAKKYVDAVATTAVKTTSIIPVKSIQILSEGTSTGVAFKPDLYRNTIIITAVASAVCLFIEIIVCLCISAFKSKDEDFNHEFEYERRFGNVEYIDHKPDLIETSKEKVLKHSNKKNKDEDILINIEDEKPVYEADDEEDLDEDILREAAQEKDILKDTDTIEEAEDEADYEAQAEVAATISEDNAGTQLDNANKNVKSASASTVQSASVEAPDSTVQSASVEAPVSTGQSVSVEAPVDAEQSSSAEVPARTETLASAVEVEKPVQEVKAAEPVNEADQSAQESDAASQKANVVSEPVVSAVGAEVDKAQLNNTDINDSEEVNSESRKFRILGTIRK